MIKAFDESINNCETILEQNFIELKPVRHGRWIDNKTCSNCGFDILYNYGISGTGFCPNCGADMRGDFE